MPGPGIERGGAGGRGDGLPSLSALLLDVWRLSLERTAETFQDAALAAVRSRIPFASALWGYATVEDTVLRGSAVHLVDLPGEIVADYDAVRPLDRTARASIRSPGRCVRIHEHSAPRVRDPRMIAFNRRYGIDSVLSMMLVQEFSRLAMFVSLYRPREAPRFTEPERRLHEAIVPHLSAAYDAARVRGFERRPGRGTPGSSAAVADAEGRLHLAERGFEHHLHAEWPAWQGPVLPADLAALARRGGEHRGRKVVATAAPARDGFTTFRVRVLQAVDLLSPREREIAEGWAAGRSALEIAAELGLSTNTVRNRVQDLYVKLGVRGRAAIADAIRGDPP